MSKVKVMFLGNSGGKQSAYKRSRDKDLYNDILSLIAIIKAENVEFYFNKRSLINDVANKHIDEVCKRLEVKCEKFFIDETDGWVLDNADILFTDVRRGLKRPADRAGNGYSPFIVTV